MTMDRNSTNISQRYTRVGHKTKMQVDKILHLEMGPLVEEGVKVVTEGNYTNRNNYRPNYRNRSRGRWNNHRSGDRSGNYPNYNRRGNMRPNYRQNPNGLLGIEVKVGIEMKIMTLEVEVETEIIEEERNPGLNLTPG